VPQVPPSCACPCTVLRQHLELWQPGGWQETRGGLSLRSPRVQVLSGCCCWWAAVMRRKECRCTPVHNFVVLSMQRSGSGWFETFLNSHPNVSSFGEIFGKSRGLKANLSHITETLDQVYNLEWHNSAARNSCTVAAGFKWMLNQVGPIFPCPLLLPFTVPVEMHPPQEVPGHTRGCVGEVEHLCSAGRGVAKGQSGGKGAVARVWPHLD